MVTGNQSPPPNSSTGTSSKRQRREEPPSTPTKRRRRGRMPSPNPTAGEEKKKAKRKQHHLKRSEVPEDAVGLKLAFETHIRLISGAFSSDAIPEPPSKHAISMFERRFSSSEAFTNALHQNRTYRGTSTATHDALKAVRLRQVVEPSATSGNISRIPDHVIRQTFATLHGFGLTEWRPDLIEGTPTSPYNTALESIAISTFETAAVALAYSHLSVNLDYLKDVQLLRDLYRNFVWSYLKGLAMKEKREPGSLAKSVRNNATYRRRDELTKKRKDYLRNNGFNKRVQMLANDPECTSDDERKPNGNGFFIFSKSARNPHVTSFFRTIDKARIDGTPVLRGQRGARPQPRESHDPPIESDISRRVPLGCPLDWFSVEYFNRLDCKYRAEYIDAPIALPGKADYDRLTPEEWKKLSDAEFMKKYGDKVKKAYNLPTAAEILAMADESGSDDGGGSDANGGSKTPPAAGPSGTRSGEAAGSGTGTSSARSGKAPEHGSRAGVASEEEVQRNVQPMDEDI
ncbi:hypothetical protein EYR36_008192 [Pleurotus pulmonarius]|nr:hypothetical protein EYR36_008192 [Pleurotus pulmonarius]KAF4581503.1 hypothetical protein EYR38_002832 [Pleurotus pulmonarius]KAF4596168.1 hypothetical protein EYR38_007542 [Pleurotus pulmonarius]